MNIIAAMHVNLERSPVGTRSRLADELAGATVLRRTVERALRVEGVASLSLLTPAAQADRVQSLVDGLRVTITRHDAPEPPYRGLVTAGRHWGLDGWRGGAGGLCCFDEDFDVPLVAALAGKAGADAVLVVPAAAPLLDAALLSEMVAHYRKNCAATRMTFVQAAPGLAGIVIERTVLEELATAGLPPGAILAYQPNNPMPDLTGREACFRPAAEVVEARGRLVADTHRSVRRLRRAMEAGAAQWGAQRISRWLREVDERHVEPAPQEIELELTTEDDAGDGSLLRPRGAAVGRRGPVDECVVERMAEWIGAFDDVRLVLGGFGEPARHPNFTDIVRGLRGGPAMSIAVRTGARHTNEAIETALFDAPVDLVEIAFDAHGPETYRRVNGVDAHAAVARTLDRWIERRTREQRVRPLIVPSMVKSRETLDDMEPFYETWQRRLGHVLVEGYSHCARQRPDRRVTSMTPPARTPCRRVVSRALILADGRMTTCDQDFAGRQCVGNIFDESPQSLWMESAVLRDARRSAVAALPLCGACDEWHRP